MIPFKLATLNLLLLFTVINKFISDIPFLVLLKEILCFLVRNFKTIIGIVSRVILIDLDRPRRNIFK